MTPETLWPALISAALAAGGAILGAAITTARQFGRLEARMDAALDRLEALEDRVSTVEGRTIRKGR